MVNSFPHIILLQLDHQIVLYKGMISYLLVVGKKKYFPGERNVSRAWSQVERNLFPTIFGTELFLMARKPCLKLLGFDLSLWVLLSL